MTLNRFIILLFAAIIILGGCQKNDHFTISGKVTHAEGDTIYLEELLVSSRKPIAQVQIDKNGKFEFEGVTNMPTFYLLKLSDNNFITLLVDSIEQVVVEADAANFGKEYILEGSVGSMQIKKLTEKLNLTEHKLDSIRSLNNFYKTNPDYKILKLELDSSVNNIIEEQSAFSNNFVLSNPFSMASVFALYQKYNDQNQTYVIRDLQTMRTAASALNSIYPNSDYVKALYENTLQFLREEKAAQVQKFIQEQGENSPEITLPDTNGKDISLSSLRGKVVLLHFWAAEDRGSRILNSLLVDAYRKYKSKGFEIYQVNVGTNRSEWIDAIDKDKLTWINVGDLNGSVNAAQIYNVQTIPFNYLMDRDGAILAKNLKGPGLDKALAKILK